MTTKWDEPAIKVDRFWCDEASNIRCVREADYDDLSQRLHESLEKHRATLSQLEQKERECEGLRKDAERWKWLENNADAATWEFIGFQAGIYRHRHLDAAMAKEGAK
jgi:hypothetical protein